MTRLAKLLEVWRVFLLTSLQTHLPFSLCSVSDEELFGDFEDLETGEVHKKGEKEEDKGDGEGEDDMNTSDQEPEQQEKRKLSREERIQAKKRKKAAFDAQYPENPVVLPQFSVPHRFSSALLLNRA